MEKHDSFIEIHTINLPLEINGRVRRSTTQAVVGDRGDGAAEPLCRIAILQVSRIEDDVGAGAAGHARAVVVVQVDVGVVAAAAVVAL